MVLQKQEKMNLHEIIGYALVAAFLSAVAWWIYIQEKYRNDR